MDELKNHLPAVIVDIVNEYCKTWIVGVLQRTSDGITFLDIKYHELADMKFIDSRSINCTELYGGQKIEILDLRFTHNEIMTNIYSNLPYKSDCEILFKIVSGRGFIRVVHLYMIDF